MVMLRRTYASKDSRGRPIVALPAKEVIVQRVAFTPAEKEFYSQLLQRTRAMFNEFLVQGIVNSRYAMILSLLLSLRQACDHPFLLLGRAKGLLRRKNEEELEKAITTDFVERIYESAFSDRRNVEEYAKEVMKEVKKMAKRKEELPAPGAPAWTATFGDLMNLLLCFFVMLFAMSTVDSEKFKAIAESFSKTFSIFEGGATSIGDGLLISNGVSQLNDLDQYVNNTGKTEEGKDDPEKIDNYTEMKDKLEEAQLNESEQLAEKIDESVAESNMTDKIDITFTSQYVQLTLKGALLFDSGKTEIRAEAVPVVDKVGSILENYAGNVIEIEGHTDNVPMHSAKYANNSELSCGRALAVYDYLISTTNLDPSKIKYAGRGEYVPVADNSTEEGRAKNRRVEIRIYHDLSTYE